MKLALASAALAAVLASPAMAQPPTEATAEGSLTIEGVSPEKALGAIDTTKLVGGEASASAQPPVGIPVPETEVTVETTVTETPAAVVETKTEIIEPVQTRPAVDPDNPIAPEVKAVVATNSNYSTADISRAQLAAMKATPASLPTTTITTKTTIPKSAD